MGRLTNGINKFFPVALKPPTSGPSVRKVELALGDVGADDELGVDLEVHAEVGIGKSIKDDVDET